MLAEEIEEARASSSTGWGSFGERISLLSGACKMSSARSAIPGNFSGVLLSKVLLHLYVAPSFV